MSLTVVTPQTALKLFHGFKLSRSEGARGDESEVECAKIIIRHMLVCRQPTKTQR